MPPNTIKVSRPSRFGNPFRIGIDGDRDQCVALYEANITDGLIGDAIEKLRGKNLACFCKLTEKCHADILLYISNRLNSPYFF